MATRTERVQAILPQLKADRAKSGLFDQEVPNILQAAFMAAAGDATKQRQITSAAATAAEQLEAKIYTVGLVTPPGTPVKASEEAEYTYLYSGATEMTHSNPLFYPGASGVYYWAIIPHTKNGHKIFPDVEGIVVAVKKDELWWDPTGTKLYRWNADDWADCSSVYYPGAAGVHQWMASEELT